MFVETHLTSLGRHTICIVYMTHQQERLYSHVCLNVCMNAYILEIIRLRGPKLWHNTGNE